MKILAFEKTEISRTQVISHDIELIPEATPIIKKPYKVS